MARQINKNRGFSLVELLISIAILSIVMLMVVQFMSTSAGAQRKTQKNIRCQVVADETMNRLVDDLMSATYIRVVPKEKTAYTIKNANSADNKGEASRDTQYTAVTSGDQLTTDEGYSLDFQLVSDNYPNYAKPSGTGERKVNINMDTYEIVDEVSQKPYPIAGDRDDAVEDEKDAHSTLRSFRVLKQSTSTGTAQYYVKPEYIYLEYKQKDSSGDVKLCNVIYYFDYTNHSIYMKRNDEAAGLTEAAAGRFQSLKSVVATSGREGRLTDAMKDFYLSADAEGNAILLNSIFEVEEYRMNVSDTVQFRNSNVLTTRPQITNRYIPAAGGTGGGAGSGGTGGGGTGSGGTAGGGTGSGGTAGD